MRESSAPRRGFAPRLGGVSRVALCAACCLLVHFAGPVRGDTDEKPNAMPIWDVNHELACKAPTGPLEDAKCNVEDVEIANTQQLSALLNDMANTTYFRLFQINLEGQCKFWKNGAKNCSSEARNAPPGRPRQTNF